MQKPRQNFFDTLTKVLEKPFGQKPLVLLLLQLHKSCVTKGLSSTKLSCSWEHVAKIKWNS